MLYVPRSRRVWPQLRIDDLKAIRHRRREKDCGAPCPRVTPNGDWHHITRGKDRMPSHRAVTGVTSPRRQQQLALRRMRPNRRALRKPVAGSAARAEAVIAPPHPHRPNLCYVFHRSSCLLPPSPKTSSQTPRACAASSFPLRRARRWPLGGRAPCSVAAARRRRAASYGLRRGARRHSSLSLPKSSLSMWVSSRSRRLSTSVNGGPKALSASACRMTPGGTGTGHRVRRHRHHPQLRQFLRRVLVD